MGYDSEERNMQYKPGQKVDIHPSCPCYSRGDKYGWVTRVAKDGRIFVRLPTSGKVQHFQPNEIAECR